MNLLRTFESRISDAFGAAPRGYAAPFSFKRLARQATREMEAETLSIDGVDTAPALYTVLVSSDDDVAMRLLYPQLTQEIVSLVKDEAARKGYVFVGEPLARFMVDPSLRDGKFAVFAENVDSFTLERLREEENTFLSGSSAKGGAAADLSSGGARPARRMAKHGAARPTLKPLPKRPAQAADEPSPALKPIEGPIVPPAESDTPAPVAAVTAPSPDDSASVGLDVVPLDFLDSHYIEGDASGNVFGEEPGVPMTQRRNLPTIEAEEEEPVTATCLLVDHQTGRTYTATAPSTIIGRERKTGNVVLRDLNVSRVHAELSFDGQSWSIRDLGSTNGTIVNDEEVMQAPLHDGDVLTLGLMSLEFREG